MEDRTNKRNSSKLKLADIYPHYEKLRIRLSNMKRRCYNSNSKDYKYYGGKGVTICDNWLNDFMQFYEWALNNGYQDNLTIDRKDVNGNYEPDNCRWVTMLVQGSNKTNNVFIEHDGEIKTISQWERETGINRDILKSRINRGQENIFKDESLIIVDINGESKTLKQWSRDSGINYTTIVNRYHQGFSPEDLLYDHKKDFKRIEYNGKMYTVSELAKISDGLTREIIKSRIKYGWKDEDLLKPRTYTRLHK